jgi:hypothetical protein
VGSVADMWEIRATPIFRVEMSRVGECSCIYRFGPKDPWGGRGAGSLCTTLRIVDRDMLSKWPF